jgi:hypothetical protein
MCAPMKLIGIQDGSSDGEFGWGMVLDEITKDEIEGQNCYRPYWIAEISEEDWLSWLEFLDPSDSRGRYTGRNLAQWERFWDSFTHGGRITPVKGEEWKKNRVKT